MVERSSGSRSAVRYYTAYKYLCRHKPLFTNIPLTMGVTIKKISPGDGKTFPKKGDTVTIHYVGKLEDGTTFDSTKNRNDPFVTKIGVGDVIKGWDEGVPQLSKGEKALLIISPDYGYGKNGIEQLIPPNSTLQFEVELLKINGK